MRHKYLGETLVTDLTDTPFEGYKPKDWAIYFISRYGQIDGSHHKQWVLDQVARILLGAKIEVKLARWDDGEENYRVNVIKPTRKYYKWVGKMLGEKDEFGEYEYSYDEGIAP